MNETYETGDRVAESAQCPKLVWDTYGTYETLDQAVLIAKTSERLSNLDYQKAFGVSKPTASRDLEDMLRKGILEKIGTTGKGTYYVLKPQRAHKGLKGLMKRSGCKGLKGLKGLITRDAGNGS